MKVSRDALAIVNIIVVVAPTKRTRGHRTENQHAFLNTAVIHYLLQ